MIRFKVYFERLRKGYLPEFNSHLSTVAVKKSRESVQFYPLRSILRRSEKLWEKKSLFKLFILSKKNSHFRLVIKLRQLNQLLLTPLFKKFSASFMKNFSHTDYVKFHPKCSFTTVISDIT